MGGSSKHAQGIAPPASLYGTGRSDDALVTTSENSTVSAWWEMLLLNKTLPPITDLFIGDTFGGRGFEMLAELKKHLYIRLVV